jgi:hypothetical protein
MSLQFGGFPATYSHVVPAVVRKQHRICVFPVPTGAAVVAPPVPVGVPPTAVVAFAVVPPVPVEHFPQDFEQ